MLLVDLSSASAAVTVQDNQDPFWSNLKRRMAGFFNVYPALKLILEKVRPGDPRFRLQVWMEAVLPAGKPQVCVVVVCVNGGGGVLQC
jgi:hypothetical protein